MTLAHMSAREPSDANKNRICSRSAPDLFQATNLYISSILGFVLPIELPVTITVSVYSSLDKVHMPNLRGGGGGGGSMTGSEDCSGFTLLTNPFEFLDNF